MKKILLIITFLLSFTLAKSQIVNYKYHSDTTCYLYNVSIREMECKNISTSIIFKQDSTVEFSSPSLSLSRIFHMNNYISKQDTSNIEIRLFFGMMGRDSVILATRNDNDLLISVGVAFIQTNEAHIFYISKKLTNGNDDSYKINQISKAGEGKSSHSGDYRQINNRQDLHSESSPWWISN